VQALFKLAQATFFKGDLEEALALAEHMRELAHDTNYLDGARLSADLLTFLLCVMDETYAAGVALTQTSWSLSPEVFFSDQYNLGKYWGQAIANCRQGQYAAARQGYAALFRGKCRKWL
jgi:hypothetical protein